VYQGKRRRLAEIILNTGQSASATNLAYYQRHRITFGLRPKNLTSRVVPMSQGEEKSVSGALGDCIESGDGSTHRPEGRRARNDSQPVLPDTRGSLAAPEDAKGY
jgi:hypothetical protein